MGEVSSDSGDDKKKGGPVKTKKASTRIDFTPMVDLGFLLITFFMLTTTLSKPQTMEINMPDKSEDADSLKIAESTAMTIILSGGDTIFYYFGLKDPQVGITNFSKDGIRKILLERNAPQIQKIHLLKSQLDNKQITEVEYKKQAIVVKGDKNALWVSIKSDDNAKYKNLVDILDEMSICNVGKYAIVDVQQVELELIAGMKK